ncbi:acyl-CoA thioesterase [Sinimarinibacterium sp. CAU 1509]|uniref:acyl-CoA thioesterase n=1 Tax=Sinimarinibacterium sp. CAU 1509 TaxID=2562283 RepID=UPI00200B79D0|nr:acyl-CoA thioesterase [Sinimarinibacterium sp. CAU 1509]
MIALRIPFNDCDPLGVVWHGNYARYFEVARAELMETIDYSYQQMLDSGYAWPVIDLHVRYVKAIRCGQRICVRASISEWEYRLKVVYEVTDADSGERLSKGHTIQVAVTMPEFEMQLNSPDILVQKLGIR